MDRAEAGKNYEFLVHKIVKKCKINNKLFNTQKEEELGIYNDIECNFNGIKDIIIEIKKKSTPDWMQCSIKYDYIANKWIGNSNNKIPNNCKKIYEEIIKDKILFNGKIPPFMTNKITYEEWVKIKKDFKDIYFDCPNDTILKLYKEKDCKYIQVSDKGLYHLGNDICNFNVPIFICNQEIRIRIKVHNKKRCKLSVTIACKPKNINELHKSFYSLDNINKLPLNLEYIS